MSGNAELKLTPLATDSSSALRLEFDFKGAGRFVVARRAQTRSMPGEYAVCFQLRGSGPLNNLEIKLVDDTGLNVWRYVFKDLKLPSRWKSFTVESRDIDFAWGPSSGRGIARLGSMEFAVVAGEGGKGTMWLADVQIEDRTPKYAPELSASSELEGLEAAKALDSGWAPRLDDRKPWIVIDMRESRVIGGLVIDWLKVAPVRGFRVSASNTGRQWRTVHSAARAGGTTSNVYLPALKTRFLRLALSGAVGGCRVAAAAFRLLALDSRVLAQHCRCTTTRLAPTLVASRTMSLDSHWYLPRSPLRAHERGRHGRTGPRVVFRGTHVTHRRPSHQLGRSHFAAGTGGPMDAGSFRHLGDVGLAPAHSSGGHCVG